MRSRHSAGVLRAAVAATAVTVFSPAAFGQLRIVQYNTGLLKTGQTTVFQSIGLEQVNGIAKPIDIMVVEEQGTTTPTEANTSLNGLVTALNGIYGAGTYARAPYANFPNAPQSSGGGLPGMIYRVGSVDFVASASLGIVDGTHNARSTIRYQIRPTGYDTNADIYVYASHMKASSGGTNADRRNVEAITNRADADTRPTANILYMGDFNLYNNAEAAYQTMITDTNGAAADSAAMDPLGTGNWTGSGNRIKHTQSPTNTAHYGGQVTGGLDDRFDFQLSTSEVQDGQGFSLIAGSYRAFGNNGSHAYGGNINENNTWAPAGIADPQAVLDALNIASDHIPVVADYRLPAKMTVAVGSVVPKLIKGTALTVNVNVSNSAPALFVNGADTLAYTVTPTGDASGTVSSTDAPLGTTNNHTVTLSTATAGAKVGVIGATTTSQNAAGNNFSQNVNYSVVDHANASLDSTVDADAKTIDFGYVPQGFAARTAGFVIKNLPNTASFTAALDLDSANATGDTASLTTNAPTTFSGLVAGNQNSYTATLTTATAGALTATQTFGTSDEDIPGATAGANLVLTTTARVLASATFPVSGFIQLNTGETYNTGAFSIQNGVTLTKSGPGTMNISGAQSNGTGSQLVVSAGAVNVSTDFGSAASPNLTLTANAGSNVTLNATQHLAGLNVDGTTVAVAIPVSTTSVISTPLPSFTSGGKLNLTANKMVVRGSTADTWTGSTYTGVSGQIKTGRNGGNWNGPSGIVTTMTDASGASALTTLAVASASDVLGIGLLDAGNWSGEPVTGSDMLVKYTYAGDADLSGAINADDYFQIDSNVGTGDPTYFKGDFNYDGSINGDDYFIIDANFASQTTVFNAPSMSEAASVSAVPEPACIGLIVLAAAATARRRRPMR